MKYFILGFAAASILFIGVPILINSTMPHCEPIRGEEWLGI